MEGKYLIVDKALLPPYCEKIALVKELIDEGKAADVSQAVKMAGISRSTFYKYRDMVRDISTVSMGRHAIISMQNGRFAEFPSPEKEPRLQLCGPKMG